MQAVALRNKAIESIGEYVQWKTNGFYGLEWGEEIRQMYIDHLRGRALRTIREYKKNRG